MASETTYVFFRFFSKSKSMTFYVFLSCCTRFPERWLSVRTPVEEFSDKFAVYF